MRLQDSVLRFHPQTSELSIATRAEIITNHLLEMVEEELLVPLEAEM
jgi:hypothetical protein